MEREREPERERAGLPGQHQRYAGASHKAEPPRGQRSWQFVATAVAAGLLAAGLAAWQLKPAGQGDPGLSSSQKLERTQAFEREGTLQLPAVAVADVPRALDDMQLPAAQRAALEKDLQANKVQLAWLTVWDDQSEDGDIVQLNGAGFARAVQIAHAPTTIAVPLTAGGSFSLSGVHDGGGGITVAAKANGHTVPLPVLDEGQAVAISMGL